MKFLSKLLPPTILLFAIFSGSLLLSTKASASVVGFRAGNIIDDVVMTDADSMSTTDIQNFLNSKVPNCDTNGTQKLDSHFSAAGVPDYNGNGVIQRWEWGKAKYNQTTFTCLRNYSQGSRSAARIIYDAAQEFTINPKVLIVLLQKEQGLVTDTWPLNLQYRSATGYACPDKAPCDSEYYGFTNQVRWAARMFRAILNDSPTWYTPYELGNNQIPWHPDTGRCGYSTVNILNRATQALYNYTPYRPNQAALNAGYGTGNSCSSYGNRNFYLYFTDWFGYTTAPMFKINGSDTIYLSYSEYYYPIPSMDVLKMWGLDTKRIKNVSHSEISSYIQGPALRTLAKFGNSQTIYLIDNGKRISIPNMDVFNDYGFKTNDVQTFDDQDLSSILSSGGSLQKLARLSSGAIYFVDNGKKRVFPDYETFTTLGSSLAGGSLSYTNLSNQLVGDISEGPPVLLDGRFVKAKDAAAIYLHDQDKLYWLSADTWRSWGKPLDYGNLSSAGLAQIPGSGIPAPILVSNGSDRYLVDKGRKHKFTVNSQVSWGLANEDFSELTSRSLSRLKPGPNVGTLLRSSSGTIYTLKNNEKVPVASMNDFLNLGYSTKSIQTFQDNTLGIIPTSESTALGQNSLVRLPNGGIYWIDTNFTAHAVPSMDIFNAFKLSNRKVRQLGSNSSLNIYTTDTLQQIIKSTNGKYFLVDKGKRSSISASAYGPSQYNFSTWQQTQLSSGLIDSINSKSPLTRFIQGNTATVYMVENGEKHPLSSPAALFSRGGNWSSVTKVSELFLDSLPTGSTY